MNTETLTVEGLDVDDLMREIERYLAAVEVFRQLGCEPRWSGDCRRHH